MNSNSNGDTSILAVNSSSLGFVALEQEHERRQPNERASQRERTEKLGGRKAGTRLQEIATDLRLQSAEAGMLPSAVSASS